MSRQIRLSPSFLNSFNYFHGLEDGPTSQSKRQELIDYLNGVERELTPAMLRGTEFETSVYAYCDAIEQARGKDADISSLKLMCEKSIYDEYAKRCIGGLRQVHVEHELMHGVYIHGYIDVLNGRTIYDIKTTSTYGEPLPLLIRDNPRSGEEELVAPYASPSEERVYRYYADSAQHRIYLAALSEQGIDRFEYLITDFSGFYVERYEWHEDIWNELRGMANELFAYLETDDEMNKAFRDRVDRQSD